MRSLMAWWLLAFFQKMADALVKRNYRCVPPLLIALGAGGNHVCEAQQSEKVEALGGPNYGGAVSHHFVIAQVPHRGVIHEEKVLSNQKLEQIGFIGAQPQTSGNRRNHFSPVSGMASARALPDIVQQSGQIKRGGIFDVLRNLRQFRFCLAVISPEDLL